MKILALLIFISVIAFVIAMKKSKASENTTDTDLIISDIVLSPPNGSNLKANEPVFVNFKYSYSKPNKDLHVWAKILDDTYESTYEGSMYGMKAGSGKIERYTYLTEPGEIDAINIVVKNQDNQEIYNQKLEVNYNFERNEEHEKLAQDGVGSKILSTSFNPSKSSVLKIGTRVYVEIEYDINSETGLDIWIIPDTECNMTYEGSTGKQLGKGVVTKHFTVSAPCEVQRAELVMRNASNKIVFSQYIDLNLVYTD